MYAISFFKDILHKLHILLSFNLTVVKMVATIVEMTKVCKSYDKQEILHNFDLYLQEGNM